MIKYGLTVDKHESYTSYDIWTWLNNHGFIVTKMLSYDNKSLYRPHYIVECIYADRCTSTSSISRTLMDFDSKFIYILNWMKY